MFQKEFFTETHGRGIYEITHQVVEITKEAQIEIGLCHIFLCHTSASLILCENADPAVQTDLETFIASLVLDGDPEYRHTSEGSDDMAAHIRTVLTHSDLTIPLQKGQLLLGTWQGIYLWEHRKQPHRRRTIITIRG